MIIGDLQSINEHIEIEIDWLNAKKKEDVYAAFRKSLGIYGGGYSSDSLINLITQPEDPVDCPIVFIVKNCSKYFEVNGYDDVVMHMMQIIVEDKIYDFDSQQEYPCCFNLLTDKSL